MKTLLSISISLLFIVNQGLSQSIKPDYSVSGPARVYLNSNDTFKVRMMLWPVQNDKNSRMRVVYGYKIGSGYKMSGRFYTKGWTLIPKQRVYDEHQFAWKNAN